MLHFGRPGDGPVLRPGMFFTIEPMVNAGRPEVKVLDDGWTAVTRDRSLSAQFEHMIGVRSVLSFAVRSNSADTNSLDWLALPDTAYLRPRPVRESKWKTWQTE